MHFSHIMSVLSLLDHCSSERRKSDMCPAELGRCTSSAAELKHSCEVYSFDYTTALTLDAAKAEDIRTH